MSLKRVVLIDESPVFRLGLRQIIGQTEGLIVSGEAADTDGLEAFCGRYKPHVLLLQLPEDSQGGLSFVQNLCSQFPDMAVLVHASIKDGPAYAVRLLRVGVAGYLCRSQPVDDYATAIGAAVAGQKYISTAVAQMMANALIDPDGRPGFEKLSDREFQTLMMLASGLSLSEIAEKEGLSVKTVSEYRSRILKKLGLRHTIELIQYAFRQRLVS